MLTQQAETKWQPFIICRNDEGHLNVKREGPPLSISSEIQVETETIGYTVAKFRIENQISIGCTTHIAMVSGICPFPKPLPTRPASILRTSISAAPLPIYTM